ncbi:MAG: isoprenylcysteine carboxylmethyltransferase family protein [Planctomycetes bacterium]|nr:isoprenylcysteine carboxylmethyltransferase family protein [Planctomycetota bacterium]
METWIAKAVFVAGSIALVAIRAPHGQRSRSVPTEQSYKGPLEIALLILAMIGFVLPFVWVFSSAFACAERTSTPLVFGMGSVCIVGGLWWFHRSHVDLGTNWSITLELRAGHRLVTEGVYSRVRHPMYAALLLYSLGNALVVPNWIAGPAYGVPMLLLFALRVGPEEAMMRARFGAEYDAYCTRSKRLVPHVW